MSTDNTHARVENHAPQPNDLLRQRFRNFMPIVVDVETAGFNAKTDALLEIACIPILMDDHGKFFAGEAINAHIEPFSGANLDPRALQFTGINPDSPLRKAIAEDEKKAIQRIFKHLKTVRQQYKCTKCILVGHNAHFDLNFLNALIERSHSKNQNQFHQFSVLDTVSLSALAFGQTVLAKACQCAGIEFNGSEAHSALYDTQKTAELFCYILNNYPMLATALVDEGTDGDSETNETEAGLEATPTN